MMMGTENSALSKGVDEKMQHVPAQEKPAVNNEGRPALAGRERCGYEAWGDK